MIPRRLASETSDSIDSSRKPVCVIIRSSQGMCCVIDSEDVSVVPRRTYTPRSHARKSGSFGGRFLVRGEGVPERVRGHIMYGGGLRIAFEDEPEPLPRQALAPVVEEERLVIRAMCAREDRPPLREIALHRIQRRRRQIDLSHARPA